MNKSQRMQLKAMIVILGVVLLAVLFITGLIFALIGREPEHIPVIRELTNVWIMEVESTGILIFEDGAERTYGFADGMAASYDFREQVADVTLVDELVSQVVCKTDKVNGKVLSVDAGGVELQGIGYLPFSDDRKGYRLYDTLKMCEPRDIMLGYDFADFVVENDEICGILLVKEAVMEYIRVLIKTGDYQGLLHDSVVFTCDTDYTVEYGAYGQRVEELHKAGEICRVWTDSPMVQNGRVNIVPNVLTGKVILQNVSRNQGTPAYRGSVELVKMQDGLAVINEVLLEEYLYSVVPSEMPASYPGEALKAQAVCARTYAYRHMLHAGLAQYGAHVDDSTGYQVYNNIAEQETATTAVKETYGQVLMTEDGRPAETYYYSTSCGIGSDTGVWLAQESETSSYLYPQPISEKPESDTLLTAQALRNEDNFAEFIYAKNEADFEFEEPWYRWTYTVADADAEMIRERLIQRYEVNPKRILTQMKNGEFEECSINDFDRINDIRIVSRGPGGVAAELVIETNKATYKVLTEYNIRYVLCDTVSKVLRQDGSLVNAKSLVPSGYFVLDTVIENECVSGYVLTGGGYGHGVGMSQNGAANMAVKGMQADKILTFFYRGCQVYNVYGVVG